MKLRIRTGSDEDYENEEVLDRDNYIEKMYDKSNEFL